MSKSNDRGLFKASVIIEGLGVITLATGLGYEVAMGEPVGYIIMSAGGLMMVFGSFLMVKARRIWK